MVALLVAPIAWAWGSIWSRDRDLPEPFMTAAAQMLVGSVMDAGGRPGARRAHARVPTLRPTLALLYLV